MPDLSDLQKQRDELRKRIAAVFEETKAEREDGSTTYDFQKATAERVGADIADMKGLDKSMAVAKWVQEKTAELDELAEKCDELEGAEKAAGEFERRAADRKRFPSPGEGDGERGQKGQRQKSLGELVTEHPSYKAVTEGQKRTVFEIPNFRLFGGQKATFETGAGWAPETTRTGAVVPAVTRPLQIVDIMPTVPTSQAAVVYMLETTRTHSAAEIAEDGAYPEDAYVLAEQTSTVRKIGTSIPVTDEQLADVSFARAYLDERMVFGVRQRLDGQIVTGNGTPPNLEGVLNVSGIQTQAKGADPVPDAVYKAMTKVRVTGRAMPSHALFHPNDWQEVRLLRTSDGIYIWGSPSEAGPERIWGLPVVQNESLSEGTGLVGSFEMSWIYLAERAGIEIEVGYVNDDFTDGRRTIRAQGRWALVVARPAAFCTVTSI